MLNVNIALANQMFPGTAPQIRLYGGRRDLTACGSKGLGAAQQVPSIRVLLLLRSKTRQSRLLRALCTPQQELQRLLCGGGVTWETTSVCIWQEGAIVL